MAARMQPPEPSGMTESWAAASPKDLGAFVDGVDLKTGPVKRWDGAARTSNEWDGLRRDRELWFRNGNCLVHLYGKGQSRRGPSFQVPFQELVAKKCYPLIRRFLVTEGPAPRTPKQLEKWSADHSKRTVELYIAPPPSMASKEQAFAYHVATRNFFAWVFRRSMVGEHLGSALVGLMHSMHEFRSDDNDNVKDMIDYLDEEGYLEVVNQPNHALAMLHLAETFQVKDLYTRALAHCVGMRDQLLTSSEYENTSLMSKKFIRHARIDLDARLDAARDMLKDFLDDELSESRLGLPPGTRSHLERFRSFLLSFYSNRLGYYPPRCFDASLCRTMRDEFEALYKLLVDNTHSAHENMPWVASGGICTLQLVQKFDRDHRYESLRHPLPLLPQSNQKGSSQRMPWRSRRERLKPDQKLLSHTALIKASNWREKVFRNDLVKAYRDFEEESVFSKKKADKPDKVSLVDGRKVRWILVYSVYQVLRSVTETLPEVFDAEQAPYHVSISKDNLPTWSDATTDLESLLRRQTDLAAPSSPSICWPDSAGAPTNSGKIEIKPDVDYFALTHREPSPTEQNGLGVVTSITAKTPPSRSSSVSRALRRNSTIRRSMRVFKPAAATQQHVAPSKPVYNEILVQGYGNGLNHVNVEPAVQTVEAGAWGGRNNSTASHSGSGSSANASSPASIGSGDTLETPTMPTTPPSGYSRHTDNKPRSQRREAVSMFLSPSRTSSLTTSSFKRPVSSPRSSGGNGIPSYSEAYEQLLVEGQRQSFSGGVGDTPVGPKRKSVPPRIVVNDDWVGMQTFMDAGTQTDFPCMGHNDGDVKPAWEQYADLGGLTEMR